MERDATTDDVRKKSCDDQCAFCGGELLTKKLKRFCIRCGQLNETCCDGGTA